MLILVGCEESQAICKAFRERGHEAYSCDIQECSGGHPEWHFKMSVFEALKLKKWDLFICHPPCTNLTYAGQWQMKDPKKVRARRKAIKFFWKCWTADVPMVCLENPRGIMTKWRRETQEIQPFQFGDPARKRTQLWLRGLPPLMYGPINPAGIMPEKWYIRKSGSKKGQRIGLYFMGQCRGKNRGKKRSKTFPGIARAMAEQWG